jgi:NADPH-dependent 2,4-dienoyl-CoA reductase/sulfur reductase-like enzyme
MCHEGGLLMKLLIVGGVAGGASAAARARRLSEDPHIVLFERGPDVSFANCGLPYYLGGEIADRNKLLVVTPERLRTRLNLDVRTRTSVEAIDRTGKKVRARDLATGREYEEAYDKLILEPGWHRSARPSQASTRPASSRCGTCKTWTASRPRWTRA